MLPPAIDLLEQSAPIPLAVWLRTLVPWVASIFVRGVDFIPRFQDRPILQAAGEFNTRDNANRARFMELQLLLAPVCAARWVVLHTLGGEPFVINDLGLTATGDPSSGEHGWAIPLGRNSVLGIFPKRTRPVAHYRTGAWWAVIEHGPVDAVEARGFNDAAARFAPDFVAAATSSVAERLSPLVATVDGASQIMDAWPFDHKTKRAHDHDWHRLISATASDPQPNEVGDLQAIDVAVLGSGWCPPLVVTLNMYDMPTDLSRDGNIIRLTMDKPKNYQDYLIRHDEEEHPPNARDVRMVIRRDVGALIDASSDLMRTADGLLVEEPREPINDATHVLWGEACRCHKSFLAILKLAENGYGEQGWVLARTMFEAVMSATWAHLNPDVARDRYDLYAAFADNIDTEARVATKGLFHVGREPVPMTSDERNEAVRLFGRHATGCWTGHSTLRALMEEVMTGGAHGHRDCE